MSRITQETVLAMELDRSHIGKLVQMITDSWSLTGTLSAVDQHDNREWDIDYTRGHRLVPRAGEIYSVLTIGPWTGRVIGNQPVTVETVAGTLEAPEWQRVLDSTNAAVLAGFTVEALHYPSVAGGATRCGLPNPGSPLASSWYGVTCPECRAFKGHDDLPPEPVPDWPKDPGEARPWLAANGNRFTDAQAKLITERLLYRPEE